MSDCDILVPMFHGALFPNVSVAIQCVKHLLQTGGNMTQYQQQWADSRDQLAEALHRAGYPVELANVMAKQLGSPRAIDRMTNYVQHGYAKNMEMLVDEMLAISADTDAWRKKKESQEAQMKYNTYLFYRRNGAFDEEEEGDE